MRRNIYLKVVIITASSESILGQWIFSIIPDDAKKPRLNATENDFLNNVEDLSFER